MANLLESVNRFRKLEEATAPKDDPAPVVRSSDLRRVVDGVRGTLLMKRDRDVSYLLLAVSAR